MTIPRLTRPRTPRLLAEAGWQLASLPGGHWWCVHAGTETETPIATSPGRAIEAALRIAEPDHERLNKWSREEARRRQRETVVIIRKDDV